MSDAYRGERSEEPTCLRCNVALEPITVIDHREHTQKHLGLAYVVGEPESSWLGGGLKNAAGVLHARVCPRCQLVAWYAHPGEPPDYR